MQSAVFKLPLRPATNPFDCALFRNAAAAALPASGLDTQLPSGSESHTHFRRHGPCTAHASFRCVPVSQSTLHCALGAQAHARPASLGPLMRRRVVCRSYVPLRCPIRLPQGCVPAMAGLTFPRSARRSLRRRATPMSCGIAFYRTSVRGVPVGWPRTGDRAHSLQCCIVSYSAPLHCTAIGSASGSIFATKYQSPG